MFRTVNITRNHRSAVKHANEGLARWFAIVIVISLVAAGLLMLLARTTPVQSKAAITVQAAGLGKPYFNFRDGQEMRVDYRGEQNLTEALQTGQAQARSVASVVLGSDGVPDLIAGYSWKGMGVVTVQHGNPDAFAPRDQSVFARLQQGYNPASMLPVADTYRVPESADFLQVGDFNHDNRKDVLVASRGGDLFLLAGDGHGGLNAPEQIALPGRVTAMTAGEFRAADGWTDVAVGVLGPSGPELLIYDGADGLAGEPMSFRLNAPATAVQIAALDNDPFMDVAVAAGSEVDIVHGWGRKQKVNLQSRVERIKLNSNARDLAVGFFIWNRAGSNQIAVLSDSGTIEILDQAGSDTRPFTDQELVVRSKGRQNQKRQTVDVESLVGWGTAAAATWTTAREFATSSSLAADAVTQNVLFGSHLSFQETDDLLLLNATQHKLDIVRQGNSKSAIQAQSLSEGRELTTTSLEMAEAPTAVLVLPQKLNGERSLVLMQQRSAAPIMVPLAPTATITVDRPDDTAAASACTAAPNDCSLRGAVQFANANAGTTILLPDPNTIGGINHTYLLNISGSGGCTIENPATGNTIGDLEINNSTTITGAGSAITIIRQGAATNDRVICLNVNITASLNYSFAGITVTGGRDTSVIGGGGIVGGAQLNTLSLTDVTIVNNQATGVGNFGGGGIQITGGSVTLANSTIGGTAAPGANRNDLTLANQDIDAPGGSGGGLIYSPGDPNGATPSPGTLTITGTTFQHNIASAEGGGADVLTSNLGTGTVSIGTSTFSSNQGGNGGGLGVGSIGTTVATTSFTSNSATNFGGGIHVSGGSLSLNGASPSIIFTSNTAPGGGSSISTYSATDVTGTNTTIGGDIRVGTKGSWTNNNGSTLAPTNVVIAGGTFICNNSTMSVGGNLSITHEMLEGGIFNGNSGTVNIAGNLSVDLANGGSGAVGQFNAGTGLFNFNGSSAQSINGPNSPTFNNLTVNKGSNSTLTLNITSPIAGNLSVSAGVFDLLGNTVNRTAVGGTLTVSNGATLKIGGANPLPTNYTTHSIGATSTIEYSGTNQTVSTLNSAQSYGNLTISGSGTKTLQGATTVATNLTINGSTLDVSASNFALNVAGNFTNNANFNARAGTVTFDGSAGQTISGTAATTFNNFTVSDAGGISMNNSNTVNAVLALTSGNITVAGGQTLTMPNTGTSSGGFDVIGNVLRTGFVTGGPALSFGNPFNTILIAVGTAPTNINVNLVKAAPAGFASAVQRTYTITPTGGAGITATLRLHYLDAELNGNTKALLNLRRFNGTGWAPFAATAADTINDWVENNAVHNFSMWTLSSFSPTASSGTLSGRITDNNGAPVSGAVINLSGAQSRKTITDASGNYQIANLETNGFYTVTPARANYNFSPGTRSFSQIGSQTEAVFTADARGDNANPLDTPEYFVRQQYVDILGREPDESGFNYWSDQILACGEDASCTRSQRTGVAAAFFIEPEAQQTGSYIYDVYGEALGRRPMFAEYSLDRRQVVGGATLDAAKTVFARNFVQRAEFMTKYLNAMTAESFVDALIHSVQSSAVNLSGERANLIAIYNQGGDLITSRAAVVLSLADNATFKQSQYNQAFVLTEYFSYLRRDIDQGGYDFWVNVLNTGDPGNYRGMVCSFVTSREYQLRFSQMVSHTNGECSGQ